MTLSKSEQTGLRKYEGLFIFPPESGPDARKVETQQLDAILKKFKANVLDRTETGRRTLGYRIKKFKEGHLIVTVFEMDPAQLTDFQKALTLEESIIKYMITLQPAQASPKAADAKKPYPSARPQTAPKAQEAGTTRTH